MHSQSSSGSSLFLFDLWKRPPLRNKQGQLPACFHFVLGRVSLTVKSADLVLEDHQDPVWGFWLSEPFGRFGSDFGTSRIRA